MATRKRAKTKKKSAKKSAKPRVKKKLLRAKAAPKKAKARASKKPRSAARPAPVIKPPAVAVDEERVGVITHYYSHLSVAIVLMERGNLRIGDRVHIKGHTSDFQQRVDSMEIDHVHVTQVGAKQEFGMRVSEHVREHDVVFKVAPQ